MSLIEEIQALEELLDLDDSCCGKAVIREIIENKWRQYFKQEHLCIKNMLQVKLMKESGLNKVAWISKYATKFALIYEKETDLKVIEIKLYERR